MTRYTRLDPPRPMQSSRVNTFPLTLHATFFLLRADEPAVEVAASNTDILGGGAMEAGAAGAARCGVFCDRAASGFRAGGECVAGVASSRIPASLPIRYSFSFPVPSISATFCPSPSTDTVGFDFLNVGGGSFSWSCADGSSGRGGGTLNMDCTFTPDERDEAFAR